MTTRRSYGWVLLLGGAVVVGLLAIRSARDFEGLVRVTQASHQAMLLDLDHLEGLEGVPGRSRRYLRPQQAPAVNRDRGGMGLYAPPDGVLLWKDVEILPGSVLRLRFSIDPLGQAMPGQSVTGQALGPVRYAFRIEMRGEPGVVELLGDKELKADSNQGVLGPLVQVELENLSRWIGKRVDLAFITRRVRPAQGGAEKGPKVGPGLFPCWRDPVIESPGRRVRIEDLALDCGEVPSDLIAIFPRARASEELVEVARRRVASVGGRLDTGAAADEGSTTLMVSGVSVSGARPGPSEFTVVKRPAVHVEPEFDTGQSLSVPTGGPRPALVFGAPGRAVYDLSIPAEPATLEFALGLRDLGSLKPSDLRPGGARFQVRVGDEVCLDERLEAEVRGWQQRSVDLTRWAGRKVPVAFEVEPDRIDPQRYVSVSSHPLAGLILQEIDCLAVEAAVARPRVVVHRRVHPRLSGEKRPNVILIVAETLRADHLGCYEDSVHHTPNIDRLAARGLVYEAATSASSWTLPSVASILTGLDPVSHGVVDELHSFLPDALETLPEIVGRLGISTVGLATNDLLSREKNFNQGFDTYVVPAYGNAHQTNQLFFSWLADHRDLQFFAYIHYYDPHGPYNAPGALREKHVPVDLRGLEGDQAQADVIRCLIDGDLSGAEKQLRYLEGTYQGEVEYLDSQVGELLARLEKTGLSGKTYVVFTADHGEEFGEHGWYGHGSALYGESTHVPLILAGPGLRAGRRRGAVESRRIFATVLDWFDIDRPLPRRCPPLGLDEAQELQGYAVSSTDKAIADMAALADPLRSGPGLETIHSIQDAEWKLLCAQSRENRQSLVPRVLYNLSDDPGETVNRLEQNPAVVQRLERLLTRWLERCRERAMSAWAGEMSRSTRERLLPKGPGYWGGR